MEWAVAFLPPRLLSPRRLLVQYYLFGEAFPDPLRAGQATPHPLLLLCLTIPCTSPPDNDLSSKFCVSLKIHLMLCSLLSKWRKGIWTAAPSTMPVPS